MWNYVLLVISSAALIDCCRFGPDPTCVYPCRCTGDNRCDPDTGQCAPGSQCQNISHPYGDKAGWSQLVGNDCRTVQAISCEWYDLLISCQLFETITILSATYGRTDTTTCPHWDDDYCSGANVSRVVIQTCANKSECILSPRRTAVGDPCPNIYKYLNLTYKCVKQIPIGNVAYGKSNVQQSGQYLHYSADLAIDGNTRAYITNALNDSCAHPFTVDGTFAWWWVDLEHLYKILRIKIVNRVTDHLVSHDRLIERSTDYDIKIGNTSDRSQQTLCFNQGKRGSDIQPVETIVCYQGDMVGRYVSFTRTGGTDPNQAAICEFIVIGYQVFECPLENCTGNCDSINGCDECIPGKMLPDCKQGCAAGYWGVNCEEKCGTCKDGAACHTVTGVCGEQCDGWYMPEFCIVQLGYPPFILDLKVEKIKNTSGTIVWKSSSGDDYEPYFYFVVRYIMREMGEWSSSEKLYLSTATGLSFGYTLAHLKYNTEYTVQIESFREINGLTGSGRLGTVNFKTLCIAPTKLPSLSVIGNLEVFKVFWEPVNPKYSGCDHFETLKVFIDCLNSTYSKTEAIKLEQTSTVFFYSAISSSLCNVWLVMTNNGGLSSNSSTVTVSKGMKDTTVVLGDTLNSGTTRMIPADPDLSHILETDNTLNIPAIAVGVSLGVVVVCSSVVIVVLILRLRILQTNMLAGKKTRTNSDQGKGSQNLAFDSIGQATGTDETNQTGNVYEHVDIAGVEPATSEKKTKGNKPEGNISEYETIRQENRATINTSTPLYQELNKNI